MAMTLGIILPRHYRPPKHKINTKMFADTLYNIPTHQQLIGSLDLHSQTHTKLRYRHFIPTVSLMKGSTNRHPHIEKRAMDT